MLKSRYNVGKESFWFPPQPLMLNQFRSELFPAIDSQQRLGQGLYYLLRSGGRPRWKDQRWRVFAF
jgi:hypothetical protein